MASSLAAEIEKGFSLPAELIEGKGGIFDVHINDQLVFSKHLEGRFPDNGEVTKIIRTFQKQSK